MCTNSLNNEPIINEDEINFIKVWKMKTTYEEGLFYDPFSMSFPSLLEHIS